MKKSAIAVFIAAAALPLCAVAQGDGKKGAAEGKISDVHPEGRSFIHGGKKYTVSGSRTEVSIAGKQADRSQLKSGMVCKVEKGKGEEASKVECK